ncbi:MAG: ABC transporter ATP-binding protein [Actinobacteria bacterium]|nr:ABC transporter ATP-binding protein [Actinomycetota bacterium]
MTDSTIHSAAGIEVRGLTKSFGDVHAVRGIDLTIRPGETVAILGPNGAGKSTTIDLLLGLATPDAGTVSILGDPPAVAVKAGRVAAMLQTGGLIREITVGELVDMVASLYAAPMDPGEALALTGLSDLAGRRTDGLSGGETQRVRFALAIVANPSFVVLDEPTVALDVEARREFWATIRTFADRGTTIVFATHYLDEADANADRIVLLADGRVVADGSVTDIKAHVGVRTIRFTLAGAATGDFAGLPGVVDVECHGDSVRLRCDDADSTLRALVAAQPEARDFEVRGADLEEAFVQLTADTTDATEEFAR